MYVVNGPTYLGRKWWERVRLTTEVNSLCRCPVGNYINSDFFVACTEAKVGACL